MDAEGNTSMTTAPDQTEAAEHYFKYIEQVPAGDICDILAAQATELLGLFETITETQSLHRHAPGRWSLRQVANDLNDTERLFVSHAFWFARGFDTPLPSFDQDVAIAAAAADERSWFSHVDEFRTVRDATLTFFQGCQPTLGLVEASPPAARSLSRHSRSSRWDAWLTHEDRERQAFACLTNRAARSRRSETEKGPLTTCISRLSELRCRLQM